MAHSKCSVNSSDIDDGICLTCWPHWRLGNFQSNGGTECIIYNLYLGKLGYRGWLVFSGTPCFLSTLFVVWVLPLPSMLLTCEMREWDGMIWPPPFVAWGDLAPWLLLLSFLALYQCNFIQVSREWGLSSSSICPCSARHIAFSCGKW